MSSCVYVNGYIYVQARSKRLMLINVKIWTFGYDNEGVSVWINSPEVVCLQ